MHRKSNEVDGSWKRKWNQEGISFINIYPVQTFLLLTVHPTTRDEVKENEKPAVSFLTHSFLSCAFSPQGASVASLECPVSRGEVGSTRTAHYLKHSSPKDFFNKK